MRKRYKRLAFLLSVVLLLSICFTGCQDVTESTGGDVMESGEPEGGNKEPAHTPLKLAYSYLSLKTGDVCELAADGSGIAVYSSSRPEVASVDENGVVTALKKGNAVITATAGSQTVTCGVMVDLADAYIDIDGMTMTPVVRDLELTSENNVMQSFTIGADGSIYIIQQIGEATFTGMDALVKIAPDGTMEDMALLQFGHGNQIGVDWDEEGNDLLWIPSMGNTSNTSDGVSRLAFEAGAVYQLEAGETWDRGIFASNPNVVIDMDSRRLMLCRGGVNYDIYDLDDFLADGEDTVKLCSGRLESGNGLAGTPGSMSYQGCALYGEYIYKYEGTPDAEDPSAFYSVFDLDGNWLFSRTVEIGFLEGYHEAEGMAVWNGKIYFGAASGASTFRRANIFTYE